MCGRHHVCSLCSSAPRIFRRPIRFRPRSIWKIESRDLRKPARSAIRISRRQAFRRGLSADQVDACRRNWPVVLAEIDKRRSKTAAGEVKPRAAGEAASCRATLPALRREIPDADEILRRMRKGDGMRRVAETLPRIGAVSASRAGHGGDHCGRDSSRYSPSSSHLLAPVRGRRRRGHQRTTGKPQPDVDRHSGAAEPSRHADHRQREIRAAGKFKIDKPYSPGPDSAARPPRRSHVHRCCRRARRPPA